MQVTTPPMIGAGTLLLDGTKRTWTDGGTSPNGSLSASRIYRGVQLGSERGYAGLAQALEAAQQLSYGYGDDASVIAVVKVGARYLLFSATERTVNVTGRFTPNTAPLYMEPTDGSEQVIDRVRDAHDGLRALVDGDYVQQFRPGALR